MINPGQNDVTRILPELVHDAGGRSAMDSPREGRAITEKINTFDLDSARRLTTAQLIVVCDRERAWLSLTELEILQKIAAERTDANQLLELVQAVMAMKN
jgi:hypothetical protein